MLKKLGVSWPGVIHSDCTTVLFSLLLATYSRLTLLVPGWHTIRGHVQTIIKKINVIGDIRGGGVKEGS